MAKSDEYREVICDSCSRLVKRSVSVLKALETKGGKVRCTECQKRMSQERSQALRKPKQEKSLMAEIYRTGLQDECYSCGARYSENSDKCPNCGSANLDKLSKKHPFRNYQISEDKDL